MPRAKKVKKLRTIEKFWALIFGFIAGAECLDDFDDLSHDLFFCKLSSGGMPSTTLGKFLREFRQRHLERLQELLIPFAFKLRTQLFPHERKFILTMDSTPHQQWGKKMEGVEWNYKKIKCLDSQNAFDQFGLSYGFDLRPGNTYSGNGAERMIHSIFKTVPKKMERFFRADSAYSKLSVYNELIQSDVKFAICLKENIYSLILDRYEFKMGWHKTKIRFFDSDNCQIASCPYLVPGLLGKSYLRVVFIRRKKEELKEGERRWYDYYAIVTNMGEHEMSNEKVIEFYRGRSNAENFIKDLKYGLDFKHFPCLKLSANKAWGLGGIFAYNLLRFASFLIDPKRGCFIKRTRNQLVKLGREVIRHTRKITLRFTDFIYQEVQRIQKMIHHMFLQVLKDRSLLIPDRGS